ncbi:hypothetical protein IMG5_163390 [Ichthyophthirius multifiliis]|uniref:Uncharacterized protein n=1 Tax=Ichthyophthirius multifiliis TaxID=5932 RepID=G0R0C1_ICHMU|nr:hypothetical protein IMG5_163390 [Ichthyophthirius multifiliis]EGR29083.1 hypothetical protein IMG5_163390 [Ichthyophthirius multifiliis]|eukprot:XP_004030319.1 hypothetical protein IMG5_163390 [Ichthyophthirius multifiliis]
MQEQRVLQHILCKTHKSASDMLSAILKIRNNALSYPDTVLEYGLKLVRNRRSQIEKEYYIVIEELFHAALSLQMITLADVFTYNYLHYFFNNRNVFKNFNNNFQNLQKQVFFNLYLLKLQQTMTIQLQYQIKIYLQIYLIMILKKEKQQYKEYTFFIIVKKLIFLVRRKLRQFCIRNEQIFRRKSK